MPDLFSLLDDLDIIHETVNHPPFFTVEDGLPWRDKIRGLHCKSLFLKDKDGVLYLLVMRGDKRCDMSELSKKIGAARLSFGKPELLFEKLGVTPGSVTPFALINDFGREIKLLFDETMLQSEWVNYHPLRNDQTTIIRAQDLLKFVAHLGYKPQIVSLDSNNPLSIDSDCTIS